MLLQVTGDIIQDIQDPDIRQQLLEPQFQLFGMDGVPHADQEWYRLFSIHSTQNPPTGDMAEKEQHRLMGNLKDDFGFQQLNEVTADDFLPNGRFAAYYIGRQLSVPTAIIKAPIEPKRGIQQRSPSNSLAKTIFRPTRSRGAHTVSFMEDRSPS